MQYFYIVGYTLIGNDLTLCKVSLNEHTLSAEELYILNHMAPRAFGLTDQQVYDIIALAIWNQKNQKMIMIG